MIVNKKNISWAKFFEILIQNPTHEFFLYLYKNIKNTQTQL